jgi:hypothetical protein
MAEELSVSQLEITKKGGESYILKGQIKSVFERSVAEIAG